MAAARGEPGPRPPPPSSSSSSSSFRFRVRVRDPRPCQLPAGRERGAPGGGRARAAPVPAAAAAAPAAPSPVVFREVKHFRSWVPWLVPTFVVANTVMLVITMYVNDCPKNSVSCIARFLGRFSFQPFKENPLLGPSSATLQKMGGLVASKVVDRHQVWLLVTCIWLHGGVFHLLANMLSLLVIGIRLEQEFGFVRIGLLYIISGIGGSLLSALFLQSNISVGASGALFGLLGGMLSELIINWSIYTNKVAAFVTLLSIIVLNLAVGILPHVDNFAHIGGFLSGFFLGFVFLIRPQFGWVSQRYAPPGYLTTSVISKFKKYQCVLWISSLIIFIVGFTVALVLLLRGVSTQMIIVLGAIICLVSQLQDGAAIQIRDTAIPHSWEAR
ncbi:hypothetical protein NL676_018417 [Syzygium grande]|nr:hypothetical protein NL676_018417 [Syzygium grande]